MKRPLKVTIGYEKKMGLPNFSNHTSTFSVVVDVEDESKLEETHSRLHKKLQASVDRELEEAGFVADPASYGKKLPPPLKPPEEIPWACSPGERFLIENMVKEFGLKRRDVSELSMRMFGKEVRRLNNQQAAKFSDELLKRRDGIPLIDPEVDASSGNGA